MSGRRGSPGEHSETVEVENTYKEFNPSVFYDLYFDYLLEGCTAVVSIHHPVEDCTVCSEKLY